MIDKITLQHLESREAAYRLLQKILASDIAEDILCEFLVELRNHPISEQLLTGFRDAITERMIPVPLGDASCIDICGTGGDGKNTFNISTLAALTIAACGQSVVKHGNSAFSSSVGSSDILQRIGIPMPKTPDEAREQFGRCGIAFLHAPFFHPALKQIGSARKKVRFRTIFNLLGPLCNPAAPAVQVLGVSHFEVFRLYRSIVSKGATRYAVLWDEGGYDEITLTGRTFLSLNGKDTIVKPLDVVSRPIDPHLLSGADTTEGGEKLFLQIASGKAEEEKLQVVAINAAVAILVSGNAASLKDAFEKALETLKAGKVMQKINILRGS